MDEKVQEEAWLEYKKNPSRSLKKLAREIAARHNVKWKDVVSFLEQKRAKRSKLRTAVVGAGVVTTLTLGAIGLYFSRSKEPVVVKPRTYQTSQRRGPTRGHRLSIDDITQLEGVDKLISHRGTYPDVIFLAQAHPHYFREAAEKEIDDTTESIESICFQLYDKFGVRSLMSEGLLEPHARVYRAKGKIEGMYIRDSAEEGHLRRFTSSCERILNSRRWNLYIGETIANLRKRLKEMEPIKRVHQEFIARIKKDYAKAFNEVCEIKEDVFIIPAGKGNIIEEAANEAMDRHYPAMMEELERIFIPGKMETMHYVETVERNKQFAGQCRRYVRRGKGPIIVILGSGHTNHFLSEIKDMNYVAVRPQGFKKEPDLELSPEDIKKTYFIIPGGISSLDFKGKVIDGRIVFE